MQTVTDINYVARVHVNGYAWRDNKLVPHVPDDEVKERCPFDGRPGLFLEFAQLPIDRDEILSFAAEYGQLRDPFHARFDLVRRLPKDKRLFDSFDLWKMHIGAMRDLVALWQASQLPTDDTVLRDLIKWNYREGIDPTDEGDADMPRFNRIPVHPSCRRFLKKDDYRVAALLTIEQEVRDTSPGSVKTVLKFDPEHKRLVKTHEPTTLDGALWLQFTQAIDRDKRFQSCRSCREPIDISDDGSRVDREYCDDACRQRESRRRRKVAKQMREEGQYLRTIAKRFDVDIGTVKGWVGKV